MSTEKGQGKILGLQKKYLTNLMVQPIKKKLLIFIDEFICLFQLILQSGNCLIRVNLDDIRCLIAAT